MKAINIVLTIFVWMVVYLLLTTGVWIKKPQVSTLLIILSIMNYIFAVFIAAEFADRFYKWFKSNIKEKDENN